MKKYLLGLLLACSVQAADIADLKMIATPKPHVIVTPRVPVFLCDSFDGVHWRIATPVFEPGTNYIWEFPAESKMRLFVARTPVPKYVSDKITIKVNRPEIQLPYMRSSIWFTPSVDSFLCTSTNGRDWKVEQFMIMKTGVQYEFVFQADGNMGFFTLVPANKKAAH